MRTYPFEEIELTLGTECYLITGVYKDFYDPDSGVKDPPSELNLQTVEPLDENGDVTGELDTAATLQFGQENEEAIDEAVKDYFQAQVEARDEYHANRGF